MNADEWKNLSIRHGLNGGMGFVTNILFYWKSRASVGKLLVTYFVKCRLSFARVRIMRGYRNI